MPKIDISKLTLTELETRRMKLEVLANEYEANAEEIKKVREKGGCSFFSQDQYQSWAYRARKELESIKEEIAKKQGQAEDHVISSELTPS